MDGWRGWQPDGRVFRRPRPWLWKLMPYKFNQDRRHKIPKARYQVTNWPEYDAALVRRGHLTVWFTDEAVAAWHAPATGERGGQPVYSDIAIETGLHCAWCFTSRFARPKVRCARSRTCSAFGSESPTIRHSAVEAAV